jgi:hypothetical protein
MATRRIDTRTTVAKIEASPEWFFATVHLGDKGLAEGKILAEKTNTGERESRRAAGKELAGLAHAVAHVASKICFVLLRLVAFGRPSLCPTP